VLTVVLVVGLVLAVSNLLVGRDPQIVALADNGQAQALLRSEETYRQAAHVILGSSFANTNKLTLDTARVAATMQKQFPELDEVSVTLPLIGHRPAIYIQPARPALLVKTPDGELFVVDTAGRALIGASQVRKIDKLGLDVVDDQSGLKVVLGRTLLPSGNVEFITEVLGQLKAKHVRITALILPQATNELDVKIEGQPYIVKFNIRGDAREEAGAFLAVKQYLEHQGKQPTSYIDVRVDNKTYYR
jgi:hypothetical protein